MNRTAFVATLREHLQGLSDREIEEISADYVTHFAEALHAGRTESEVASALGDPARLAKELRTEAGLRRWERKRTAGNYAAAIAALWGLAAVDLAFLMPLICLVALLAVALGLSMFVLSIMGVVLLASLLNWSDLETPAQAIGRGLTGLGLLSGGIGGGAMVMLALERVLKLFTRYARLHYRLLSFPESST